MKLELQVSRVRFQFRPLKPVRLEGWSGVYAGKLVYDAFTRSGCVVQEGGFFRVTPIWSTASGVIAGGVLSPGNLYGFEIVLWGRARSEYTMCFVYAIEKGFAPLDPHELEVREVRVDVNVPASFDGEVEAVVYSVEHYPTFYRFHGAIIAYPSPRRLVASAARKIVEALGGPEAAGAAAELLRKAALQLAERVELYKDTTRKQKVRISHGKDQPVFHGRAEYLVVASKPLISLMEDLLEASKLLGLGGSPGLGLGHVASVKKLAPRHELPKPVKPFGLAEENDVLA